MKLIKDRDIVDQKKELSRKLWVVHGVCLFLQIFIDTYLYTLVEVAWDRCFKKTENKIMDFEEKENNDAKE